jgi:hypothetical protein
MPSLVPCQKLHSKNKSVERRNSELEEGKRLENTARRGGSGIAVAAYDFQETIVGARKVNEEEDRGGSQPAIQVTKRKGNVDDHDKDLDETGSGRMRLPEVVSTLDAEGRVLKWSEALGAFVVLDGAGFEQRFNELRYVRSKQVGIPSAHQRPFSRMHAYFVLIRGGKWAATGSAFKFKDPPAPLAKSFAGTQFTCFTGTKVQILTPEELRAKIICSICHQYPAFKARHSGAIHSFPAEFHGHGCGRP